MLRPLHPEHGSYQRLTQRGVTLIELMIALVIGLIFSLAVLLMQSSLTKQNMQMSDVMQRDTQSRAALDLLTGDLSNAGYMLDGAKVQCVATLAYDSALPDNPTFFQYPVSATDQPTSIPTSGNVTAGLNANSWPPTGSGNVSQMIQIISSNSPLVASTGSTTDSTEVTNNVTGTSPTNAMADSTLPVGSTSQFAVGDTSVLRVPLNNQIVCFRVPIVSLGASPISISSQGSTLFPATGYSGFDTALSAAQLFPSGQTELGNANLVQNIISDAGPADTSPMQSVVYYVAAAPNPATGGTLPMLMRATLNAANDTIINQPTPIAAGVVSLQALFGVDETDANAVTNYLSWADVVNQHQTANVRSVVFALVTRTLQSNPNNPLVTSVPIPNPSNANGNDLFTAYTPSAAEQHNRYAVITSEVAVRNALWTH